jgi:hypothetical protein
LGPALSIEDAYWNGKQCDPWPDKEGTSVAHILDSLRAAGHALEHAWPMNNPEYPGPPPPASLLPANRLSTPGWQRLPTPTPTDVHNAITQCVVILSLRHVPTAWDQGPLVHAEAGAQTAGGHAVLAVGDITFGGHDTVIIRNSWGAGWGHNGFGYVTDTYLEHYLKRAFTLDCLTTGAAVA